MRDPFRLDGPTVVSFSGGRTSALMLRRILDAHNGQLPPDAFVLFRNTGKEREETLAFVDECARQWSVPIVWLERAPGAHPRGMPPCERFCVVTFETASRAGEPFDSVIDDRRYLPNVATRFCTEELKLKPAKNFMLAAGYQTWTSVVGLRADEPRRLAKIHSPERAKTREEVRTPLATAGVGLRDVTSFWGGQSFDLGLKSYEGNCDLCFLKGTLKRLRIIDEAPARADWWIAAEARIESLTGQSAARFRRNSPPYSSLAAFSRDQRRLPMLLEDDPTDMEACGGAGCTD